MSELGLIFEVVEYMKIGITKDELKGILSKLSVSAIELLRKSEAREYNILGKGYDEDELINYMVKYPRLIERPIIVRDNKACIARPLENLIKLLND